MADNISYKINPEFIVEKNLLFRIPLYQRLFTWGEREVRQLMDDLLNHFKKHQDKSYYLGMITVVKHGERFDLIDGQQRTTVLMLLAIGLIKNLPECEERYQWSEFFKQSERVFFNGRKQDREYLHALLKDTPTGYSNPNMTIGLACINDYLKNIIDVNDIKQFGKMVLSKLTLFVTELSDDYVKNPTSLNEYFEAMNSSGRSLEQHEILKVELLRDYDKEDKLMLTRLWNAVSNFERPLFALNEKEDDARRKQCESYRQSIRSFMVGDYINLTQRLYGETSEANVRTSIAEIEVKKYDFSNKTYRDKEDGIISFQEFLLLVLALHTGKDELARVHPTKLHDTFKNNPIPQEEIAHFYYELFMYRLMLDMYVVRLKYSSSSSSHTLIFKHQDECEKEEHARLRQYQAMLDISTEPHIWVLPLLKYLKSLDHEPTQMELLKFLMVNDMQRSGHNECPQNSSLDYDSKPRYWLWRLDYALWEKYILEGKNAFPYENIETEAIRQYEFRNNRSIEHLHPQNEDNNDTWPWEDVNSFGNLAMISSGFNSQQSNLPVHVKFANLEVQIGNKNLQSIKLYFMYLKAKKSEAEWTVIAKNEHSDEMLAILKESLEKVKKYGQQ